MFIPYTILLPIDNPQAVATDSGITIIPSPVTDNVKKLEVVALLTKVSNNFLIVVNNLPFL